jgi:hypothetical protein
MEEGYVMENPYSKKEKAVLIMKVYIDNNDIKKDKKYSIDIECFDVFLTEFTKKQVEKLCSIVINSAPEIQIYRHIKERKAIFEFSASQYLKGSYKVTVGTAFKDYIENIKGFNKIIENISRSIVERIIYIFTAYSIDSY